MGYNELRSDPGDAHAPPADWRMCLGRTGRRCAEPCLCTPCVLRASASHEAQNGHAECVAVLADAAPASVEQATLEGATPLLVSAYLGHLQSVHVLLRLQARTSCTLSAGTTTSAYEVAAAAGHAECTALLSHTTG